MRAARPEPERGLITSAIPAPSGRGVPACTASVLQRVHAFDRDDAGRQPGDRFAQGEACRHIGRVVGARGDAREPDEPGERAQRNGQRGHLGGCGRGEGHGAGRMTARERRRVGNAPGQPLRRHLRDGRSRAAVQALGDLVREETRDPMAASPRAAARRARGRAVSASRPAIAIHSTERSAARVSAGIVASSSGLCVRATAAKVATSSASTCRRTSRQRRASRARCGSGEAWTIDEA
jgi:hypothetical protein